MKTYVINVEWREWIFFRKKYSHLANCKQEHVIDAISPEAARQKVLDKLPKRINKHLPRITSTMVLKNREFKVI